LVGLLAGHADIFWQNGWMHQVITRDGIGQCYLVLGWVCSPLRIAEA